MMTNPISAFQAKTHLSQLLRETEQGRSFVIHRRGKPVARLIPSGESEPMDVQGLVAAFRAVRESISGRLSVRRMIDEGRRR